MQSKMRILLLFVVTVSPLRAGDWPQLLGPTRDGVSTEKLLTEWPSDGPKLVWSKSVGEGYSAPVVADGRLVLFHRVEAKEAIDCFDAGTGKPVWTSAYDCTYEDPYGKGDGPRSTPVIADGKVFALGAAGTLTCVDLAKGKRVWQKDLLQQYRPPQSFFGVGTSPIVVDDLVVVNVGGEGTGIVAFSTATGEEKWRATSDEASYSTPTVATLDGKRRLLFFTRTGLVGLDPKTGKVSFSKRWRSRLNASVNAATPLVEGDHIFLSTSYSTGGILIKVEADKLETIWSNDEVMSCHFNTPILHKGYIYGIDGRQETGTVLNCVEWETGKLRWSKRGLGCASLIRFGEHLLILSEFGDLVLAKCDPKSYQELGRARVLTGPIRAHFAVSNALLFARDNTKLICLRVGGK